MLVPAAMDDHLAADRNLLERWLELREAAAQRGHPVPLLREELPVRAQRLVDDLSCLTVQELLDLAPEKLFRRKNFGRKTLAALLAHAEQCLHHGFVVIGAREPEAASPDFVAVVDALLRSRPARACGVLVARFEHRVRPIDVAASAGVVRERVRQIEEKFVTAVSQACARHNLLTDDVLADGVITFEELSSRQATPLRSPAFYVALARTVLTGAGSYVDVERFFAAKVREVADDIRGSDRFVLAQMSATEVLAHAQQTAPCLRELGTEHLLERLLIELDSRVLGDRLVGRKPQVSRIIRALLRAAAGVVHVTALSGQLRVVLATYGEVSYFDDVRLRYKLASMAGVHLASETTVSLAPPDLTLADMWVGRLVEAISVARKPVSLVSFLDAHPDAPYDAFGLASLLRDDDRITRVGRQLYASPDYRAAGSLRVAALMKRRSQQPIAP